ncbi:MAG: three-helix bundle dimerization domain-containing protein [Marmoricola sp.]
MSTDTEARALEAVRHRLESKYPMTDPSVVRLAVDVSYEGLRSARIREFIPVLVEREASDKLSHLL